MFEIGSGIGWLLRIAQLRISTAIFSVEERRK
jgi:hypothetical protein